MSITHDDVLALAGAAETREDFWVQVLNRVEARRVAEIGVFRGAFAEALLDGVPGIETYYMVDPWRHLDDWNKPANVSHSRFDEFYEETMRRTQAHESKRVVLRGRTTEVLDKVEDDELDFLYIDGDHTLRGIAIDLVASWPKVRHHGWVGGDDFTRTIWQHGQDFEPSMVFPFAVYFAEAVGCPMYAVGRRQFLIEKRPEAGFSFADVTGKYPAAELLPQLRKAEKEARQAAPAPAPTPSSGALPRVRAAAASVQRRLAGMRSRA